MKRIMGKGFRYIDRGRGHLLVLVPGWASDWRIFGSLNLDFDYLVPLEFSPFSFEKDILSALKKLKPARASFFGWSLGGFTAAKFAVRYPALTDELILVSIRSRYLPGELAQVKGALKKNKKGWLYKFYKQCFTGKEESFSPYRPLFKEYAEELDLEYLLLTLDYLENARINPALLKNVEKMKIVHGEDDIVAPFSEAMDIQRALPRAGFIAVEGAGHIPFLKQGFTI